MDSYDILLILVSIAFIVSLVVWIIVGVLVIQVLRKLKNATEKAQAVADNFEAFTSNLKSASKATMVGAFAKQVSKIFRGGK